MSSPKKLSRAPRRAKTPVVTPFATVVAPPPKATRAKTTAAKKKTRADKTLAGRAPRVAVGPASSLRVAADRAGAALDELLERIAALRERGAEAFDALYEAVADGYDGDPPLYAVRYATEKAYLRAVLPNVQVRTAKRNLLIAVAFSPDDEDQHSVQFLEAAALYAKVKQQSAGFPRAINLDRLRVEVTRGREKLLVAARRATERELDTAREALLGRPTRKRSPARDAVRAALDAHPELLGVTLEGGDAWLTFRRVPLDALDALARALKGLKLPTPK